MRFGGGFRLRRRVTTLFQRFRLRPRRFWKSLKPGRLSWFHRARFAVRRAIGSGYVRVGQDSDTHSTVPKGYLAVYVGRGSDEWVRVLMPVNQFNHPLFGELLKEAEAEFGYEHPGGITIPCRISEFEDVRMRIEGGESGRRLMTWRR